MQVDIIICYGNLLYTSIATENGVVLYQTASLNIIEDGPMIAYAAITETLTDEYQMLYLDFSKIGGNIDELPQRFDICLEAELYSARSRDSRKVAGTYLSVKGQI